MSSDELANAATLPGSGDASAGATRLAAGTVLLERYRIDRWLGAGGMGAVYAAHDRRLDQRVALKFVAGARSEVERERLRAEVRTLQGLTHRGIARTFTFDEADGEPFIVMELLDGETLSARIGRGALDEPEARAVIGALAAALDEAHRAGVVHRDVKPANVMLCPGGRVVLMDFGLARSDDAPAPTGESRSVLMTTSLKGTPAYLAPEMALGRRVDARADLYSLGVLAYEALTGKLPFEADSAKGMIDQHVERVPDDVRARRPELSAALGALIARLLAKEPGDRPASAAEVLAALTPRRRPRWPVFVALGVIVAVAGAITFAVTRPSPRAAVTERKQDGVELEFLRGQTAFLSGNFQTALDDWERAYALEPMPQFLYNMGLAAEKLAERDQAVRYLRRYLDAAPDAEDRAAVERRIAALESGSSPRADEADARAAYDRGEAAFRQRDYTTAYEEFMHAYTLSPAPAFLFNVGASAQEVGRLAEARFYLQRYLELATPQTPNERENVERRIRALDVALDAGP